MKKYDDTINKKKYFNKISENCGNYKDCRCGAINIIKYKNENHYHHLNQYMPLIKIMIMKFKKKKKHNSYL